MSKKQIAAVAAAVVALTMGAGAVFYSAEAQQVTTNQQASSTFRGDLRNGRPILLRKALPPARVQWQAALDRASQQKSLRKSDGILARLPKAELDRTRLPVILPRAGVIDAAKAKLVSFGDAYALNMPQAKGVQITMYGNRSFVPAEAGAVSKRPVARLLNVVEDVRISQMEDGWTGTFTRYGVVYSLDVSCDDIKSPDCQSDGYIRNAIAQFDDVTLGAEAQAEANKAVPKPANWLDGAVQSIRKLTKAS
ncbi:hypothetical protein MMA231_01587 [Asticcacaulis sp. MM231]|uniref:hypothetical protein n=1 Tax=Asticcacaulis sp. MM231 TaxID=3157666 RepID=UPI0032D5AB80